MDGDPGSAGWQRVLLKLSGEVLAGSPGCGIDTSLVSGMASVLVSLSRSGYQIGVVTGAGNFVRGRDLTGIRRTRADYMGMLATILNGLALLDSIEKQGGSAAILSAFPVPEAGVEPFSPERARELMVSGSIVLFTGGTGNPLLTTDTAAALRAAQTGCEVLLKGTKVDGVYDRDPVLYPGAKRFRRLSYGQVLELDLRVMDAAAVAVCRDSGLPIVVFDVTDPSGIERVLEEPSVGTLIGEV